MDQEHVKELALKLESRERAELAQDLIASLDNLSPEENERLWLEEAERRYEKYRSGKVASQPTDEVFKEAYERFK